MDLLYPQKKDSFECLVADFTPTKLCPAYTLLSSNYDSASQIAHRIDIDVARLDELCRAMRSERNNYVPILRLPVEVLGHIIGMCAHSDPPEEIQARDFHMHPRPCTRTPAWLGFIRLGHVCGLLRRVLLGMPALWATVAFTFPKGHAEILERARNAPLTINLHLYEGNSDLIKSAKTHLQSARIARMKAFSQDALENMMYYPVKHGLGEHEELEMTIWNPEQDVPRGMPGLTPLRAPRLRRLKLQNYFIPVNYSSLETLVLVFQNTRPTFGADPGRFRFHGYALLDVLSRCTSLGHLYLSGMQFEALPPSSPSRAPVSLPLLKCLRMSSGVTFCRSVRSNLILGCHTCVEVILISYPQDEAEPQAVTEEYLFISELVHLLGEPEAPTITGIRLDHRSSDLRLALAVTKMGTFTFESQGPFRENQIFVLDVCLRRYNPDARATLFRQFLHEISTHIVLTGVSALALTVPRVNPITTPEWLSFLAPFDAVRNLVCDEFPMQRGFWDALCPFADSTDAAFILPNLRTLFAYPDEPYNRYATLPDELVGWEDMPPGFRRRAEREAGIERIVLGKYWDRPRLEDPEDIRALRSVVPQVVDTREYKDGHLMIPHFDDFSTELWSPNMYQ